MDKPLPAQYPLKEKHFPSSFTNSYLHFGVDINFGIKVNNVSHGKKLSMVMKNEENASRKELELEEDENKYRKTRRIERENIIKRKHLSTFYHERMPRNVTR